MLLAPVVRDRKGEFVELFADMQSQGYVRFRVDGRTFEAADVPKLKKSREARHRRRHRPHQGRSPDIEQRLAESFEAALRIADGRPAVEPRPRRDDAAHRRSARAPLLEQVRLPDLRLLAARARAAPVLVQLAGRRLPDLRRPRRHRRCSMRSAWSPFRASASPAAPSRAGTGAMPTPSRCSKAWPATTASTSTRRSRTCPTRRARCCCTARAARRSSSSTRPRARAASSARSRGSTRSKASCPISSGAFARPIRSRCARTWCATRAPSPAPIATARACASRRATSSSSTRKSGETGADLSRRALHAARKPRLVRAA